MPEKTEMPKATGSMEGFFRSRSAPATTPEPPTRAVSSGETASPANASSMEISTQSNHGKYPATRRSSSRALDSRPSFARRQSSLILQTTFSPEAVEAAAAKSPTTAVEPSKDKMEPTSMVCTVEYRGMEVIVATTSEPRVFVMCPRTQAVLQTLDIPSGAKIVSILSNPATGMVAVAMSNGTVQTYHPVPTKSKLDPNIVVSAFGKFRWITGQVIQCRDVFYGEAEQKKHLFRHEKSTDPGHTVEISSSSDHKVLVTHRDQLAVFDVTPTKFVSSEEAEKLTKAELLWTVRLEYNIATAELSGDGYAVAVVVEGDGFKNKNPFGVRTFLRDSEDGSSLRSAILEPRGKDIPKPGQLKRSMSSKINVGILYKPGPFLVHSASVSRISFRGFGHETSNVYSDQAEGNDLLLTHCENGNSMQIFSQNSWKQLMQWTTPPNTRADWIRGISAFNLGDLESHKRRKTSGSAVSSRRPSMSDDSAAAINADLLGSRPLTYQGSSTAAGAWIAEITFRDTYPALRLSRLSYMKRGGDDMKPAHFESVAAILPSCSLAAECVLGMGKTGLSVQGIWPAWNPWWSESSTDETEGTLSGSAMAFLGLSSVAPTSAGFFGEHHQSGTHGPPSELRLVASHPSSNKIVLMEFPMWGDNDFGAMELGSPLRYLLSLSEIDGLEVQPETDASLVDGDRKTAMYDDHNIELPPPVSLHYETNVVCSQIDAGRKSISISWRRQGSILVLPAYQQPGKSGSLISVSSSESLDSSKSYLNLEAGADSDEVEVFKDLGIVRAPLSLPSLHLPKTTKTDGHKERFVALQWFSDEIFSGPPQLLAVTSLGAILLYELPPIWSALEPAMPSHDPAALSTAVSIDGNGEIGSHNDDGCDSVSGDYEVMITPHPDFGIGLRLEAQVDGVPAIAGSFKKHPLNGGQLPAERTGMISLGDELLSVNGISLEGIPFDDIIATVRKVAGEVPTGTPLCMKFRPMLANRKRIIGSAFSLSSSQRSEASTRRTTEEMLGVKLNQKPEGAIVTPMTSIQRIVSEIDAEDASSRSNVSNAVEIQPTDEWTGRIIAHIKGALPKVKIAESMDYQSRLALLPWNYGCGASTQNDACLIALLIVADGSSVHAKRLDIRRSSKPHEAQCTDLGSIDFKDASRGDDEELAIRSVEVVPFGTEEWCIAVHHVNGTVRLAFIEVIDTSAVIEHLENEEGDGSRPQSKFEAKFRHYCLFETDGASSPSRAESFVLRAASVELFACLSSSGGQGGLVTIWCAKPSPTVIEDKVEKDPAETRELQYVKSTLRTDTGLHRSTSVQDDIIDVQFIPSGALDSFPWVLTLTSRVAVVYRRDGRDYEWKPIVILNYPSLPDSVPYCERTGLYNQRHGKGCISPADTLPHLIPTLRSLVSLCDERHFLRSDWRPDAILAYACSDVQGIKTSLRRNVKGVYLWLAQWLHSDVKERPTMDAQLPLGVVPLRSIEGHCLMVPADESSEEDTQKRASSLMSPFSSAQASTPENEDVTLLAKLQEVLCPRNDKLDTKGIDSEDGKDTQQRRRNLPDPIERLNADEIRLLWAMGEMLSDPPQFNNLDPAGQLTIFSVSLRRHIYRAPDDQLELEEETNLQPKSFHVAKKSSPSSKAVKKAFLPIASAGCLSALTSSKQGNLVEACRDSNSKFAWETARSLRLPLWIRSDTKMRAVCEEIGQTIYKETRDVMECALFFVIVRNMRTLRNLAMTDQTLSGRTFLKFISDQDFTSPRGRKAAEKNAYSLLRKHRYRVAAAFFLLAEPPMLKSALEVIVTQMEDLDLAFLVARMIETSGSGSQIGGLGGAVGGFGMGFGGMMGLGGGYAAGGGAGTQATDEVPFDEWTPKLRKGAKSLINDRCLPLAIGDPCLKALLLVWLGRREEGSRCLSGLLHDSEDGGTMLQSDAIFPRMFDSTLSFVKVPSNGHTGAQRVRPTTSWTNAPAISVNDRVVMKANYVVDFVSCPFLVKSLNASIRTRWASTLLVSRALMRRGFELAAVRLILQNTDILDLAEKNHAEGTETAKSAIKVDAQERKANADVSGNASTMTSSIFDSYEGPQRGKATSATTSTQPSSIFDSFDPPPQKPKQSRDVMQDPTSSSIFDGFDVPPPTKPSPQVSQTEQMTSSIFDSFDAPPQKPRSAATTTQAASSIFGAFDTAPPKMSSNEPQNVSSQSGEMTSSIFDSFETQPTSAKPPSAAIGTKLKPSNDSDVPGSVPVQVKDEDLDDTPDVIPLVTPKLWEEWRKNLLTEAVARRLLREMASIVSCFQGDTIDTPMKLFRRHIHPLVPSSAGEILLQSYEGDDVVDSIKRCLDDVCLPCKLNEGIVVDQALRILSCSTHPNRIVYIVLLCTVLDRTDQAEEVVRIAAATQIQRCETFACANDQLVENRKTMHHIASQYLRRLSAQMSWQLEVCLWLNRGGTLPLSENVVKQAVVAVRVGLVVASWGRNHECLETMLRCEPDTPMDFESGRQLWTSMKLIVAAEDRGKKTAGTGSGGWEFLVDCRRDEATEMLRNRLPGSFIIRPHPEDTGVFTLSFKTNLIPTADEVNVSEAKEEKSAEEASSDSVAPKTPKKKPVKKDDVVQHAIIRLSDAGFRCGSFGPFATLMQLLEAVSASLPFNLLFDRPPTEGIIKDEGTQPSPNAVFLRKLALSTNSKKFPWNKEGMEDATTQDSGLKYGEGASNTPDDQERESDLVDEKDEKAKAEFSRRKTFGMFLQLLVLSEIRKQLSAVAAAEDDDIITTESLWTEEPTKETGEVAPRQSDENKEASSVDSLSSESEYLDVEESYMRAARIVRPLLNWCRSLETGIGTDIAPVIHELSQAAAALPIDLAASETAIELAPQDVGSWIDGGDAVVRRMIQPESGVEFRTVRVGEGFESAMIVLFSKSEAVNWLVSSGAEKDNDEAVKRLARMEKRRVIEPIAMKDLTIKAFVSNTEQKDREDEVLYRFVDPWEVESLESREAETMAAALGREYYYAFNVTNVARSCEGIIRHMGNLRLLGLWTYVKGGIRLTKAIASVHAPWERDAGGDLQMAEGVVTEPSAYSNSIRKHLYRNALFRRLTLPQRFLALVQVELLDLKNLTSPGGSPSLTVFALLRLKRPGSSARLTNKARTLDSAATPAVKIGKSSGPNAPASWGSVVRFRFPLPEDANCDGVSSDGDREALFKGPPSVLQISVYEKKFMSDISLGGADISLDALTGGGQLEEWVPLRASKQAITWFARVRLTLRFELMCLGSDQPSDMDGEVPPSVGLHKIQQLSKQGGAYEDTKVKKSASTPDLFGYFESMVS